jgi:hypothetical protein
VDGKRTLLSRTGVLRHHPPGDDASMRLPNTMRIQRIGYSRSEQD